MTISRDPDKAPEIPNEMVQIAAIENWTLIAVTLDEHSVSTEDARQVTFVAMTPSVPRIGETIVSDDGIECVVKRVAYKVIRRHGYPMMMANVLAEYRCE